MDSHNWIRTKEGDETIDAKVLLDLYKIYQDRQLWDLRLLFSYTNFYAAALLALLTAFVVALVTAKSYALVGLLTVLPLAAHFMIWNGRITAWRFYRRYTEGKVRLTKIEYALDLDRQIPVEKLREKADSMWAREPFFLPRRYFRQASESDNSIIFTHDRSLEHGLGKLTQMMFATLLLFAWGGLFVTPICLFFLEKSDSAFFLSVIISISASVIAAMAMRHYKREWKVMQDEYLKDLTELDSHG